MYIVPIGAIVSPVKMVEGNAASDRINSEWLINYPIDIDTYWTQYIVEYLNLGDQQESSLLNCTI